MQYAQKHQEYKPKHSSGSKGNSGNKPNSGRSRHVQYKPKFNNDALAKYQPKTAAEKDSTCSSSPSDASQSNSSVEREERQSVTVLATSFAQQHKKKDAILDSESFEGEGGEEEVSSAAGQKKFKSCIVDNQEQINSLDLSRSSDHNTMDETHTVRESEHFENQSDLFSVHKLTFEPASAIPSQSTSRRASIDSQINLDQVKAPNNQLNAPSFVPSYNPMSSVAKPFMPSTAAPYFKPTAAPVAAPVPAQGASSLTSGLNSLSNFNNDFTPSTPYVHKFRTEMCKNFELYGKCKYGDEVSYFLIFNHFCSF